MDIGSPQDSGFLGWGWHFPEEIVPGLRARWTGAPHATDLNAENALLYIDLTPESYELALSWQSFGEMRQVQVRVNEQLLATVDVEADSLSETTIDVPQTVFDDGSRLTLSLAYGTPETPESSDRALGLMVDWIEWRQTNAN